MGASRFKNIGYALLGLFVLISIFSWVYLLVRTYPRSIQQSDMNFIPPIASQPESQPTPIDPHHIPVLVITKAVYGDLPNGASADVTTKVAGMVMDNTLTVDATNDNFGDSAPNIVKSLRVDYTLDGIAYTRLVHENAAMHITGPPKLIVTKAVYGDLPNGPSTDVTAKVAALVDNDQLTVAANNDNFGDPAVGTDKTLRVNYRFENQEKFKTALENETLTISNTGD